MTNHHERMLTLISHTRENSKDIPYGCSIYSEEGQLLITAYGNHSSPVNHAEIVAIDECAMRYPTIKWDTLSLYTTGEPCCMCAAACCWANLKEVIYATPIPFMIDLWGIESTMRAEYIINHHPKKPQLIKDVCAHESNAMFLDYKNKFTETLQKNRWTI